MVNICANIRSWDLVVPGDTILHQDELVKVTGMKPEPEDEVGNKFVWVTYLAPGRGERTFMAAADWLVAVVDSA